MRTFLKGFLTLFVISVILAGCAAAPSKIDYSAFKESNPHTILVLPPLNESPDAKATEGLLSQVTYPLAESGYYVLPVALVEETFHQNGLTTPNDMQAVASQRLREIFGADAALYLTVTEYGSKYQVLATTTVVAAHGKLVDLRTGHVLWTGAASANDGGNGSRGLIGALVSAALNSATDSGHAVAGLASQQLLSAGTPGGILYGPRSPKHGAD